MQTWPCCCATACSQSAPGEWGALQSSVLPFHSASPVQATPQRENCSQPSATSQVHPFIFSGRGCGFPCYTS